MPDLPQVIIITPTLGRSRWLDQTVESVAAHTRGNPEMRHVLVAPGDQVKSLASDYPQIEVTAEEAGTLGLYDAVNYGLRVAGDWDWMTYLNDDDLLGPGFERSLKATADDSVDVIYGRVTYIGAEGRVLGAYPVESQPRRFASLMAAGIPPITQQGTLVRRDCFDQLAGFDPKYRLAADFEFWVRAVRATCSFRYLPVETGLFRLRKGQLSADQNSVRSEIETILANHLPRPGHAARFLVRAGFRLRHVPEILARRVRTGHWRTARSIGEDKP
jgi:glycosyltransferase involved in cell wall biosynthesis